MAARKGLAACTQHTVRFSSFLRNRASQSLVSSSAHVRQYSDQATSSSSSTPYESPFKEFFNMMERGETSLGTKDIDAPEIRYLKCGVREDALRFKTVHYGRLLQAPHVQPGEHSVTLKVFLGDLNLNEVELEVLKQIVSTRISEERNELRLTSDQFGSRIENKRHLVSMLDRLVMASKQLAQDESTTVTAEA